ncbi:MAG: HpcH/HpaI aldolase/citrate lyase family protein [Candidatus Cyclobacteriaceae bacterium M3_2C_046]
MHNPYLLRSLLFVPAHNDKLLNKAASLNVDALLLDLEDSVQPAENKEIARQKIIEKISQNAFQDQLIFPRVNDRESGHLLKDVSALTLPGVHGFMYPKSNKGEDIYFFSKLLETIEYEKGYPIGTFKIIALIETTGAVLNAQDICKASDRVIAIAFGCEDFVTDLHGIHDTQGQSIFTARAMISMAARANGKIPVDTVHINVHDLADLEKNLHVSRTLGFEGMLLLNPKEIDLAHKYYSPTAAEIEDAKEMIILYESSQKEGKGVAVKGSKFIGPPMYIAAKKLLQRADQIKNKM